MSWQRQRMSSWREPQVPGPAVMATATGSRQTSPVRQTPDAHRVENSAFGGDLSDIKRSLEELITLNRELISLTKGLRDKPSKRESKHVRPRRQP